MSGDEDLAARCLAGDEDAWEALVHRYHRAVWNVAFRYTGRVEEADELTQEIFTRLTRALRQFDGSSRLSAWILRVARNRAVDHYRRHRRERALTAAELTGGTLESLFAADPSEDPHRLLEQKETRRWLREALGRLPAELREAIFMRDIQEVSYQDMADLLELPLGTVKSRINRGRLALARELKSRRARGEGVRR